MKKWEYLFVRFDYFAGELRPQSANGKDFRDKPAPMALHDYANVLGEEGWEMVGLNYTPAYGYGFLTFKRPKEEEAEKPEE